MSKNINHQMIEQMQLNHIDMLKKQQSQTVKQKFKSIINGRHTYSKITQINQQPLAKQQKIYQLRQSLLDEIQKEQYLQYEQINNQTTRITKDIQKYQKYQNKHRKDTYLVGAWIGIIIALLIFMITIIRINGFSIQSNSRFSRDFPTWRGIALFIFYIWILGFDLFMLEKYNISYKKIFNIKEPMRPRAIKLFIIAGFHTTLYLVLFLLYLLAISDIYHIPGVTQEYFALMSWSVFAIFLIAPLPTFSHKGRFFALKLLIDSLLSPLYGVTFPITWMTDQLVSMTIPFKDLQYTVCYYTELDYKSTDYTQCQDLNRASAVVVTAVVVCSFRSIQCMRQGWDKGEYFFTPFFFNTIKYCATIIAALLAFEYKLGNDNALSTWILFAVISSLYSYTWDMKMDWDLLQKNPDHPFLRKQLTFKPARNYYIIAVGNFMMRLTWVITFSPSIARNFNDFNLIILVTAMIQIFRRGVWNLLRIQKQHIHMQHAQHDKSKAHAVVHQQQTYDDQKRVQNLKQIKQRFHRLTRRIFKQQKQLKKSIISSLKKKMTIQQQDTNEEKPQMPEQQTNIQSIYPLSIIQQNMRNHDNSINKKIQNQQEITQLTTFNDQIHTNSTNRSLLNDNISLEKQQNKH